MEPSTLLRHARVRAGLTQQQLAVRARTSQPVVSAYEHGRRDPSIGTLRRLLAAADVHLELRASPAVEEGLPRPADLGEHGRRLVDLLLLADALPARRTGPLDAPRLISS